MPESPTASRQRFDAAELRSFAAEALMGSGLTEDDAALTARLIVQADMRGVSTHGLVRLPMYTERLRLGGIDPRAAMEFVAESGATAVLDARGGMGYLAADRAMRRALDLAAAQGLGAVSVRGSGHFGSADGYAMLAPPRGMIGMVTTNAPPAMAPTGGLVPLFGTNPWAMAIPAAQENPVVMDFALTAVARGRIRSAQATGTAIPDTWALDAEGRPTTDPAAALKGILQPIGGHKGYAMALAVDVLAGLLSGASSSTSLSPPQDAATPQDVGHFVLAIDVGHFLPVGEFTARVDALVRQVRGSRRAPGVERLYVPGEIEDERMRLAAAEGVPLTVDVVAGLTATARACGLRPPHPLGEAEAAGLR